MLCCWNAKHSLETFKYRQAQGEEGAAGTSLWGPWSPYLFNFFHVRISGSVVQQVHNYEYGSLGIYVNNINLHQRVYILNLSQFSLILSSYISKQDLRCAVSTLLNSTWHCFTFYGLNVLAQVWEGGAKFVLLRHMKILSAALNTAASHSLCPHLQMGHGCIITRLDLMHRNSNCWFVNICVAFKERSNTSGVKQCLYFPSCWVTDF